MSLRVITPPTEVITVAQAAAFMRIDFPDDETEVIEAFIVSARQWCEEYLRRRIGVQTVELVEAGFPASGGIILAPPVVSVTSVKYIDTAGVVQTMDAADYRVATDADPGTITPVGDLWPSTLAVDDALRVRYITGYDYGNSPIEEDELPSTIRTAMLMLISDMYENRVAQVEKPLSDNLTAVRLLSMYRLEMSL